MKINEKFPMLNKNLDKLQVISELKHNWDLYNADPIREGLVDIMKKLILELKYQPEIFPCSNGTIQFEYEKDNGELLKFNLVTTDTLKKIRVYDNNTSSYSSCRIDCKDINEILDDFFRISDL